MSTSVRHPAGDTCQRILEKSVSDVLTAPRASTTQAYVQVAVAVNGDLYVDVNLNANSGRELHVTNVVDVSNRSLT